MTTIPHSALLLVLLVLGLHGGAAQYTIGVNYGMLGDNLPTPGAVAAFLRDHTTITAVKLFDSNPDVIRAFADTNISLTLSIPNSDIPSLTTLPGASAWVSSHVLPFIPASPIRRIAVGNEVLFTHNLTLAALLLPALKSLRAALTALSPTPIQLSTAHSFAVLPVSQPPSAAHFRRAFDKAVFAPLLRFLRETHSPFMINPYPYFGGVRNQTLAYALFKPNPGFYDEASRITYTNMFDAQLDATYTAMRKLGFGDVEIVVAETGWPSVGDADQPFVNLENAVAYNGNLVKHVNSGLGTPLMPNRTFETFIFSLFNEDLKPGPTAERNFGLFRPDFTPVYDVGILRAPQDGSPSTAPGPTTTPAPSDGGKMWCVPKADAGESALQSNIDYVCSLGIDCTPIQWGGPCFDPNTVRSHASYAMNAYYQTYGRNAFNCDFAATGTLTPSDPSYDACLYVS